MLIGCSGKTETPATSDTEKDTTSNTDQTQQSSVEEEKIYTAVGVGDGYEERVYVIPEDESIKNINQLPEFNVLHVIPQYTEPDGLGRFMNTLIEENFSLWGIFEEHTGEVVLFYDEMKRHKAITFTTEKGNVQDTATVYTPKGRVLAQREYKDGKWIKNIKSPGCADWTYDQGSSSLTVNDLKNGQSRESGVETIRLIPSLQRKSSLDEILDKSSYVRPFLVNKKEFTGTLLGYTTTTHQEDFQRFELQFKEGLLHGDVKVYSDLFGMTLHEVFDEGELAETVFVIDWEEMDGVAKPVIYLYPEETTDVTIALKFQGALTHTYPKYKDAWTVQAQPDGTLTDEKGQEYYALYWEGENETPFTLNEGTIVKGDQTIEFLETSLETLGLNRREANEFIMYWLPRMENNPYNLIHFSTSEYEAMAQLDIQPKPETMIRVMMVFQPLKSPVSIPEQDLELLRKERKGFTAVEWGGKEVHRPNF